MNIRKKILYNPSHLKSAKPDSSDNTTANTKNSAILDQSKTFRLEDNYPFSNRKSKNYLRTLSKQIKKQNSVYSQNIASSLVKKNHVIPSFSTLSNQNLPPLKKGILKRKFLLQPQELPPITSIKRPTMLSSQNERKPPIFPSSQINSNKDLYNPNVISKKQFQGHGKIPMNRILGFDTQQIERRKQQLNSMNAGSFYTTQKSIGLSKFSIGSKQSSRNENLSKNSDRLSIQRQRKPSKFIPQQKQNNQNTQQAQQAPQQNVQESMQESITQEIERNKDTKQRFVTQNEQMQNVGNNQWKDTLKSSLYESKTVEVKPSQNNEQSDSESSLCESQQINQNQLQEKKKTCRLMNLSKKQSQKKYSFNKDQDFGMQTFQSQQQSSCCESYQIETPQKHQKSHQQSQ